MNTITVFLCIQACLVQNVFGQCLGKYEHLIAPTAAIAPCGAGLGLAPFGHVGYSDLAYPAAAWDGAYGYGLDAYGGVGEGNVAVAGELPVAGATAVVGQVPIMGAVKFGGDVAAGGAVSIAGKCACDCGCADGRYWY